MAKKTSKSEPKNVKNTKIQKKQQKQKEIQPKKYKKTQDAMMRIQKSKSQRIFLLSAQKKEEQWSFTVQGTKMKNYVVKVHKILKCNCMDFIMKKKPCKHIYFIVTQVAQNEQILDYFRNSTTISINAYNVLDSQLQNRLRSRLQVMNNSDKKDIDLKDDKDCVICFTQMNKDEQILEDCNTCKKYFHTECISRWKDHNPTCPLCRGNLQGSGNNPLDKLQKIIV